ncbi:dethiobiotin synthase [Cyphellophora europaea CBS 101466]|uniref:Dethiobiotin synthase n=1 Tax=Cyphellophora europaea (strain CBS 101466) TaxID=1220924 RepID=W2RSV9_CYPE1|nr:dethiobiotin synthase [Cyphellophora europaea CBS 101466]ETN38809.1 dethiobiotin synthase [Cyphellophora europaea CBS 101466]
MLWRDLKAWQVYGANTDVGKTIVSTVLCKALQRRAPSNGVLYLKPVSTGPLNEADDRHISRFAPGVVSKCLSQFSEPVSPHLAAKIDSVDKALTDDSTIVSKIKRQLNKQLEQGTRYALLETAGGILSPGPSGSLQADLYRPLRLPTLLIGDHKLGGIATTISAFESLHLRGYDVDSLLLFDDPQWGNFAYLQDHFAKHDVQAVALPLPPPRRKTPKDDEQAMAEYYEQCSTSPGINTLLESLNQKHFSRVSKLTSLPSHADSIIWHPFRQHGLPQNIIAIDSAYGDTFEVYNQEADPAVAASQVGTTGLNTGSSGTQAKPLTTPLFDASASWWTQGFGHGNPELSLTAAHAAGRYGHVMFGSAVHEPALDLCYNLLETLRSPRLTRVFFTDNGSTGMEVAVKMALRATSLRYGWTKNDGGRPVEILGLKGSYHGDTIGVMNASEPSVFNEAVDWYQPWGTWFDPPSVLLSKGKWHVSVPSSFLEPGSTKTWYFQHMASLFDFSSRETHAKFYRDFITKALRSLCHDQGRRFGALVMEPIIMGAGGMIFVDPLFQHTLITTIRENPSLINPKYQPSSNPDPADWSGLPLIADEVFTGLYRLGRSSSSSFLSPDPLSPTPMSVSTAPDVSVHAKLLTGGILPLALTTASNSIFNAFLSDSKTDALLHGHSYTAHPIGCSVANHALKEMERLDTSGNSDWQAYRSPWAAAPSIPDLSSSSSTANPSPSSSTVNTPYSFFSPHLLTQLSHHPLLSGLWSLGTVLALTLKSTEGTSGGYASNATASLQSRLLTTLDEKTGEGIHARVLGDVIYFMCSLTTKPDAAERLGSVLLRALDGELEDQE